jgi:hypothetical protein
VGAADQPVAGDRHGPARARHQLILGSASPAWAHEIIADLDAVLTHKTLAVLDGQGHDAINLAPELLVSQPVRFFS